MTEMNNISVPKIELPKYNEIPGVGLFLEQVSKYINECLAPLEISELTGSMISNYVKKDIIDNPVKKTYSREQIAYLIYIAIAKQVLSLEDINSLLLMQREICDVQSAYEYFSTSFPLILSAVFGEGDISPIICSDGEQITYLKKLSQNVSITVANKIYLDMTFEAIRSNSQKNDCT